MNPSSWNSDTWLALAVSTAYSVVFAGVGIAGDVEAVLAGVHVDNVERESASLEDAFLWSIRRGGSAAS
jgi:hypothetical protein